MQQLVHDGVLAIVAGADTTSSALTSLTYLLPTHPDVYEKLQAEIDKFYPAGEDALDMKHHRDMPYLTAVMYAHDTLTRIMYADREKPLETKLYASSRQCQVPQDSSGLVAGNMSALFVSLISLLVSYWLDKTHLASSPQARSSGRTYTLAVMTHAALLPTHLSSGPGAGSLHPETSPPHAVSPRLPLSSGTTRRACCHSRLGH